MPKTFIEDMLERLCDPNNQKLITDKYNEDLKKQEIELKSFCTTLHYDKKKIPLFGFVDFWDSDYRDVGINADDYGSSIEEFDYDLVDFKNDYNNGSLFEDLLEEQQLYIIRIALKQ